MSIEPGKSLLHYHIIGKIGEGGMGAVYRATDSKLNRDVALKVLPADMASHPDRLERFQREARAVAALNHPHIVTIYSVEQEGNTHFLTMELVEGKSLAHLLPPGGLPLAQVFDIAIALADALSTAHVKGIVHRDLKPANVMLSTDGRIKVLDFGLAKLAGDAPAPVSAGDPDATSAETAAAPVGVSLTQAGAVMGTVPYMSPEQLEGRAVDHRTDIFALGVVLYEISTGNRPFLGDSSASLISAIMRDTPRSVAELRQDAPRHLARIIDHCLQKSVTERFQSALDIRNELRTLRRELDSGGAQSSADLMTGDVPTTEMHRTGGGVASGFSSAPSSGLHTAVSAPPNSGVAPVVRQPASAGTRTAIVAAAILGLGGLAFGVYSMISQSESQAIVAPRAQDLSLSILMSRNDLESAALSADGRYLAYVTRSGRLTSLVVRQVRTGSDIAVVPDSDVAILGIRFSPDGDYLYYRNRDPDLPNYSALFQVPSLGGAPAKVFFDVDSAPTFSPDGTQVCFRRGLVEQGSDSLVIGDMNTKVERELARIAAPLRYETSPMWSPDGKRIAIAMVDVEEGVKGWAETIDVASGENRRVGDKTWLSANSLGWTPDGNALMVSAFEMGVGLAPQILRLPYPVGPSLRMTNDLDGYGDISLSTDGTLLVALRRTDVANLWVIPENAAAAPITFASGSAASVGGGVALPGGEVVFSAPRDNRVFLWHMKADGSERRQLTSQGLFSFGLQYSEATGLVFNRIDAADRLLAHIWRINPDGEDLEQLTDGGGEQVISISPTGDAIMFTRWDDPGTPWIKRLDGSDSYKIGDDMADVTLFSPDGQQLLVTKLEGEQDSIFPHRYIIPVAGGDPVASFLLPPGATSIQWAPDGHALTYVDRARGWNLMRKPLPDGDPVPITRFRDGQIVAHRWHPDGSRMVLLRRFGPKQSLWSLRATESEPVMLTEFNTGVIAEFRWAPDEPKIYFTYRTSAQDVVLIGGFE